MSFFRKFGRYYFIISLLLVVVFLFRNYSSITSGKTISEASTLLDQPSELEKMVSTMPGGFPAAKLGVGVIYQKKGQLEDAERMYRQALSEQPNSPDAWFRLGTLYMEQQKWTEAADAYEHTLKIRPDSAYAHNDLALAYDQLGRHEEALKEYEEAARLDPNPVLMENLTQARSDLENESMQNETVISLPQAPVPDPGLRINVDDNADHTSNNEAANSFVRPQEIFLKNGHSVTGDIVQKDEEGLWLQVANNVKTRLLRKDIDRIEDAK